MVVKLLCTIYIQAGTFGTWESLSFGIPGLVKPKSVWMGPGGNDLGPNGPDQKGPGSQSDQ
jgi:hypothetical protein